MNPFEPACRAKLGGSNNKPSAYDKVVDMCSRATSAAITFAHMSCCYLLSWNPNCQVEALLDEEVYHVYRFMSELTDPFRQLTLMQATGLKE